MSRRPSMASEDPEGSLWETLEDIENIFEKELRDLKGISLSGVIQSNSEYNNGNLFEEEEILIWNCGLCGSYYFKDHSHFSSHLLEHHSVDEREGRSSRNFYGCLSCGNGFQNLGVLENHLLCEELCQKDYDKALLALYQSHSVPRFFAPLHLRCMSCQDKFDQLYRLLQYFPNCSHLERNPRKRKICSQGGDPFPESESLPNCFKKEPEDSLGPRSKRSLRLKTREDACSNRSPPLSNGDSVSSDQDSVEYIHCRLRASMFHEEDNEDMDTLISMSNVKSKGCKLKRKKSMKALNNFESAEAEGERNTTVCYGFNGGKWVHSRPSNRIKTKKTKLRKIKFKPSLNLDGNYDEDLEEIEVISVEGGDSSQNEAEELPSSTSKEEAWIPCVECKIDEFESRSAFIFHALFIHSKAYCCRCDLVFDDLFLLQNHEEECHSSHNCDRCSNACFPRRVDLLNHLKDAHNLFPCPFCHYILSKDAIKQHLSKNHRVKEHRPLEEFQKPKIISELSLTTATCSLCRRKKPLHKMVSHFMKWHNFTSPSLFELLLHTGFTLDTRPTHEESTSPCLPPDQEMYSLSEKKSIGEGKFPKDTYPCPFPDCESSENRNHDFGLHLLTDHGLKYCFPCDSFIKSGLKEHTSLFHCDSFKCPYCERRFDDVFSLLDHRLQSHALISCILCNDIIFTQKEDFYEHLRNVHCVSKSWYASFDMPQLFRQSLVSISSSYSKLKCNLCEDEEVEMIKCSALRLHLSLHHKLKALDLLFASYDGISGFNLSPISSAVKYDPTELKDEEYICITERDVKVILENPSPISCKYCEKSFQSMAERQAHINEVHSKEKDSFRCDFCPISTSSLNGMKNHLLKVHKSSILVSDEFSFKCSHCEEKFWSLGERRKHINELHMNEFQPEEDDLTCKICMHNSPNKNALRRHFQRMHPSEPLRSNVSYECEVCQILFQWKSQLHSHMKEMHKESEENECSHCKNIFKSSIGLKSHEKSCSKKNTSSNIVVPETDVPLGEKENEENESQSKNREEMRSIPPESVKSNGSSKIIVSKVPDIEKSESQSDSKKVDEGQVKIRKLKCEFCSSILETFKSREEHYMSEHNGLLPFTCDECHKGFSTKSSLKNHKSKHGNFRCEVCSKEFYRRDSFNEHQLIHKGPRYTCPHCPKEFVQKSNLQRHIRIHLGIKPFKCKYCPKMFSDSAALKAHESVHLNIKLKCNICLQTFARKQKLNYHMRIHTGDGLLICDICQKVFTNSYSMKRHLLTHSERQAFTCVLCSEVFSSRKKLSGHLRLKEKLGRTCSKCGLFFQSETELNAHMFGFHMPTEDVGQKRGYQCRHCDTSYNGLSDIRNHLLLKHDITQDLTFHFINGFRNEQEAVGLAQDCAPMSTSPNVIACALCGEMVGGYLDLGVHLKDSHEVSCSESGTLSCPVCKIEIGPLVMELNDHIISCHSNFVVENEVPETSITSSDIKTDFE